MGFFSAIGAGISAIGTAISTIGSAVLKVGATITSCAADIGKLAMDTLFPFKILDTISTIVSMIAHFLGLTDENENFEEMGAKATQDGVKSPEKFDSIEQYIKYLKEDVELDEARFNAMSKDEKLGAHLIGVATTVQGVEEKSGVELSPKFLVEFSKMKLENNELKDYIKAFKDNGINDMEVMTDYLTGKAEGSKADSADKAISEAISAINPGISEKEIDEKIGSMINDIENYKG